MPIDYVEIGKRIRSYRIRNCLSQEQLAEMVSLSSVHIGYIERGKRIPSLEVIINIANALHVSADDLLSGSLSVVTMNEREEYSFLRECTSEEQAIISQLIKALKDILKKYRIS